MEENGGRGIAMKRLVMELIEWEKASDPRMIDFVVKVERKPDGTLDLFNWDVYFKAREESFWWQGEQFQIRLEFTADYPAIPPVVKLHPFIIHLNVTTAGLVAFPLIDENRDWRPIYDILTIALSVRHLLDNPSVADHDRVLDCFVEEGVVFPLWERRK